MYVQWETVPGDRTSHTITLFQLKCQLPRMNPLQCHVCSVAVHRKKRLDIQ